VNTTNPRAGSWGSLVNVNYDTVEEVRIVALGSKAEYGSYSGAAIDVLTKSGSNEFHGSGAFYSLIGTPADNQPAPGADLGADYLYVGEGEQLAGETQKDWEAAFTAGGPIVKDRLWFFGAFDYIRGTELPPRWSLKNESWGRYADVKLSAAPFTRHRAWLSYHYESNKGTGWSWGPEPGWDTTMTYGVATKNHTISGQWQWFPTGMTTLSAKYLGFWTDDQPFIPDDAPDNPGYINWWKWAQYGVNGAFPYVEAQKSKRQTLQGDISHYAEEFLGEHDMKFGVQYTKGQGNWMGGYFQNYVNFLYPYRYTQNVSYMQSWYGDTGLLFYNNQVTLNPFLTVRTADSFGVFFDDQWTPTRRLTINLGLRFDRMTTRYGTGKVYEFLNSPDEINDPPPILRDRAGTGNIYDFKTWSPRVGLTYMLTGDGKTVVRAAWGRYYMPINVESLQRFGPDMPMATRNRQVFPSGPWSVVDANGDGMIDPIETRNAARMVHGQTPISEDPRSIDYSWMLNVADDLKDQYTDHLTLNLEREIIPNFSVSASYIFKHAGNLFAHIPSNEVTGEEWEYERIPFTTSRGQTVQLYSIVHQDYNGDGLVDDDDVGWVRDHADFRVENMGSYDGIKPKRDYHGFQLVLQKRLSSRWQGLGSVLYSVSEGMASRPVRQSSNIEGPMMMDTTWMWTLNQTINNLEVPLPFTPKWEFKLSGSYRIPRLELDVGLRLRAHSGRPVWLTEGFPSYPAPGGVIGPPGSLVADEEPDYLPSQTLFDLHLERAFSVGGQQTIHVIVDGFNIFNSFTPTDIDYGWEYGKVTGIPTSRRFRIGARYQF
jgi:hypothetical protein